VDFDQRGGYKEITLNGHEESVAKSRDITFRQVIQDENYQQAI